MLCCFYCIRDETQQLLNFYGITSCFCAGRLYRMLNFRWNLVYLNNWFSFFVLSLSAQLGKVRQTHWCTELFVLGSQADNTAAVGTHFLILFLLFIIWSPHSVPCCCFSEIETLLGFWFCLVILFENMNHPLDEWLYDTLSVTCQRYMQLLSCHRVLIFGVAIVVKCYWEKKFRFCDSNQAAYVLRAQRRAVEDKECYRHNWRPDTNVQQASLSEQDAAKQCVW